MLIVRLLNKMLLGCLQLWSLEAQGLTLLPVSCGAWRLDLSGGSHRMWAPQIRAEHAMSSTPAQTMSKKPS